MGFGLELAIHELSGYRGLEYVDQANEKLRQGDSVLVIGNHPNSETAAMVVGETARRLDAGTEKGILASSKFWGIGGNMGWTGDISLGMMQRRWGIEPLAVAQGYNSRVSDSQRREINMSTVRKTIKILRSPGGVMWMYQEGTRCPRGLGLAQEGINVFVAEADWVLQAVADYGKWRPGRRVEFLPLFPAGDAVGVVAEEFDVSEKSAAKMVADYLMVRLALHVPEKWRGDYAEAVATARGEVTSERWAHLPAMFWLLGE